MSRKRGISLTGALRRLTTTDEPKKYENWPASHPYAYTIGDFELRKAYDFKAKKEDVLFFAPETVFSDNRKTRTVRKIFISFKIKRISDVDNVKEQFQCKFHIYFNWLPTYSEYISYLKARDSDELISWEPKWYPHLDILNKISDIEPFPRWEEYPDEGAFRMSKFKDFFNIICDDNTNKFDGKKAYFIRAKYDLEMILSEELELQAFPFDCQDLSIVIRESSTDMSIAFLPEMRKKTFGSVDPRYSVIDEWDMEASRIELGTTNAGSSRSQAVYPMIIIRLKMKRRWQVFMWNVVFLMICVEILALTAFALDPIEEAGDRLGLCITLVLTAVAFLEVVKKILPPVPYLTFLDQYILSGYVFLMAIMIETAVLKAIYGNGDCTHRCNHSDTIFMWCCAVYLVIYQILFSVYGVIIRKDEISKLIMDSDEIEKEVNQERPTLEFDYRRRTRQGNNNRLLAFQAYPRTGSFEPLQNKIIANELKKSKQRFDQHKINKLMKSQNDFINTSKTLNTQLHTINSSSYQEMQEDLSKDNIIPKNSPNSSRQVSTKL